MEFDVILQALMDELLPRAAEAGLAADETFIIVLDNGPVHTHAEAICGVDMEVLPHPAHSPDCNKPVEHTHSFVDMMMKDWLVQWREQHPAGNPTVAQCKHECEQVFRSITAESIEADIMSLPETWQAIVDRQGGWLPDALR
jgi:hypothetical protein